MNRRKKMLSAERGVRKQERRAGLLLKPLRVPHSAFRNSPAFTLIEVMMAMTIFALVMAAIYSSWDLIMRASRVSQEAAARVQRQRVAVHTLEDALTCVQSFQASMQYYSFIVSEEPPELDFTARLPDNFPRNGKFGDLNVRQLQFSLAAGQDTDHQEKDLVLRQKPILLDMDEDEQKNPLVLARYVQAFKIECWDTNQAVWVTEWDNTNSIPPLIRVNLVLGSGRNDYGNNAPTLAVSRVIAVPCQTMPAAVQMGTAAGGRQGNNPIINRGPSSANNPNPDPGNRGNRGNPINRSR
jgi:prepilin-type N-terminal cleavage/methylation domain-containing protein